MALGSPLYMCPEIVRKTTYDTRCDVWAIGVTAYILISGCPPFYGEGREDLNDAIMNDKIEFDEEYFGEYSADAIEFINAACQKKQADRPFVKDLLKYKWITDIKNKKLS